MHARVLPPPPPLPPTQPSATHPHPDLPHMIDPHVIMLDPLRASDIRQPRRDVSYLSEIRFSVRANCIWQIKNKRFYPGSKHLYITEHPKQQKHAWSLWADVFVDPTSPASRPKQDWPLKTACPHSHVWVFNQRMLSLFFSHFSLSFFPFSRGGGGVAF